MKRRLVRKTDRDGRLTRGKFLVESWILGGVMAEYATQQANFEQDAGKRIERSGVAPLRPLHSDAETQCGFRQRVIEQDDTGDDFHEVARDAVKDALDVMHEDHRILEGVQFVRRDPGTETEASQNTGQASDIHGHAEVAPQKGAGVGAISGQGCSRRLVRWVGYDLQSGFFFHAWASARSRFQKLRKEIGPPASEASACLQDAHKDWSLPERRTQMFPQRSQYLSCMLPNCTGCLLAFMIYISLSNRNSPGASRAAMTVGLEIQSETVIRLATGLVLFAMTCLFSVFLKGGTPKSSAQLRRRVLNQPTFILTGEIALFIARLQNYTVLNDDANTTGEMYLPEELYDSRREQF